MAFVLRVSISSASCFPVFFLSDLRTKVHITKSEISMRTWRAPMSAASQGAFVVIPEIPSVDKRYTRFAKIYLLLHFVVFAHRSTTTPRSFASRRGKYSLCKLPWNRRAFMPLHENPSPLSYADAACLQAL